MSARSLNNIFLGIFTASAIAAISLVALGKAGGVILGATSCAAVAVVLAVHKQRGGDR